MSERKYPCVHCKMMNLVMDHIIEHTPTHAAGVPKDLLRTTMIDTINVFGEVLALNVPDQEMLERALESALPQIRIAALMALERQAVPIPAEILPSPPGCH